MTSLSTLVMFIHVLLKQKSSHPNQQCKSIEGICQELISVVYLVQTLCIKSLHSAVPHLTGQVVEITMMIQRYTAPG